MFDFFGKGASELKSKKLWLFDMDGTIYKDDVLFSGTLDLLSAITANGGMYVFITNNSSKSVQDYLKKLHKLGISATEDNLFTSTQASVLWFKNEMPGARIYSQGTNSFIDELKRSGLSVTEEVESVDAVLIGFDTEVSMGKLRKTCEILSTQDVVYLATNPDLVCPVSFGFIPDCGSICQIVYNATGKTPVFLGKPKPTMVDILRTKFEVSKNETVVIGDRLYTDIAAGVNAGVTTICVLTGEADVDSIRMNEFQPTYTFESVRQIAMSLLSS